MQPWLIDTLGDLPGVGKLFRGPPFGIGLMTAGLVLAVMVLPFITSVMREVFLATPRSLKEAAYGLGATQWEVVWDVVLPNSTRRRHRRHHARAWPCARRDDGGDLRGRQRASHLDLVAGARHHDLGQHRQ